MHANEALDPVTAPLRGAQRGLVVRTVFGQVTVFHVKDDGPAACAAAPALIHRLGADIEASASDSALAAAFDAGGGNKRESLRGRRPWRAERRCGPKGRPDVRGPLQPATALRIQWATQ
ncbi:MAG: hypothetical protein M3N82_11465 [Pseudomonadota bacterium]|nr:hypothetical protein [Pseudomonadota bacterium]